MYIPKGMGNGSPGGTVILVKIVAVPNGASWTCKLRVSK